MPFLLPRLSDLVSRKWDVFISYAHEDSKWADRICDALAKHGLKCWRDVDCLRLGESFDERIADAIRDSQVILLLLSKVTPAKAYVAHEITTAQAFKRCIAPVFLELIPFSELKAPFDLRSIRTHHRTWPADAGDKEVTRICDDLKGLTRWRRMRAWVSLLTLLVLLLATTGTALVLANHARQLSAIEDLIRKEPVFAAFHNRKNAPAAVKPRAEVMLFGRTNGAADLRLTDTSRLRAGDLYHLEVTPRTTGWLYVFQVDAAGKIQWLFPRNSSFRDSQGINPVKADTALRVPSEPAPGYELDDTSGTERIITVMSATRWGELEAALEQNGADVSAKSAPLTALAQKGLLALSKGTRGLARPAKDGLNLKVSEAEMMSEFVANEDWLMVVTSFEHVP